MFNSNLFKFTLNNILKSLAWNSIRPILQPKIAHLASSAGNSFAFEIIAATSPTAFTGCSNFISLVKFSGRTLCMGVLHLISYSQRG